LGASPKVFFPKKNEWSPTVDQKKGLVIHVVTRPRRNEAAATRPEKGEGGGGGVTGAGSQNGVLLGGGGLKGVGGKRSEKKRRSRETLKRVRQGAIRSRIQEGRKKAEGPRMRRKGSIKRGGASYDKWGPARKRE